MRGKYLVACLVSALGLASSAVVGCSSEASRCGASGDCLEGQVCEDGVCQTPSNGCVDQFDCLPHEQCLAGQCTPPPTPDTGGADNNDGNTNNANNPNPTPDASTPDVDYDNVSPRLVSVAPADGTANVGVDASFTLTFDEPLEPTSVNFQSIQLLDPSNGLVATTPAYTAGETTVVVTPNAPLMPATGYRIKVTSSVRDPSHNPAVEAESRFYTGFEEPADLTALAQTYAPTIYQSLGKTTAGQLNVDLPTRVDFDANAKARDNKAHALQTSRRNAASVYYAVTESQTHYFLTYVLYYPARKDGEEAAVEHDFTGVTIVVDREFGLVRLAEGVLVNATGVDRAMGFAPSGRGVSAPGNLSFFRTFDVDGLEDETHYPLYIPDGVHRACNWYVNGPGTADHCVHTPEAFPVGAAAGVILRPGEAQTYLQAVEEVIDEQSGATAKAMEYELVPLAELYARRVDIGQDLLWERDFSYAPMDGRPSTVAGHPIKLPGHLMSDDTESAGKPPFAWVPDGANAGQWLLDPAYILSIRYDLGDDYSMDYCYNLFLGIDLRDAPNAPACATTPPT